ncbi:MAG: DUF3833 family protein [Sphingomonas phyllosphaerae]
MLLAIALAAAPVGPAFDPLRFFTGQTSGTAQLKVILRSARGVTVRGTGRMRADGTLVLDQIVTEADKPPRPRRWVLRGTTPGHYVGTLSDAHGPVVGAVTGATLRLSFTSNGGFRIRQTLTLQPDGRTLANRLEARRFGIRVAVLTERIVKVD